ncbi:hypothetical protein BS50DRAFT_658315 [Corynespora cassiicola Philippines]|uniref:Metallo-beta-lactamase domain-containing protein n=1 Tax=Corynespora cassiicola Philippines TaxID=1448308 RepID=A0A2T2P453_CORCC|nr:hypothetical protein BS50DRAFT_658315 [Corynespora cassiicola Philippines]
MPPPTDPVVLPSPLPSQTYITLSALEAGHLTLPSSLFITPSDPSERTTVPSLSFLLQHHAPGAPSPTYLIFDLGLKRDTTGYRPAQQSHIADRHPLVTSPDAADSLRAGGLQPGDISTVLLSHVHWDHIGTPADFANARFVVGSGTLHLLAHGGGPLYPAHLFRADELPPDRTVELPPARPEDEDRAAAPGQRTGHVWRPMGGFPAVVDFFGDASLYVVDAPGHLYGHVNLLVRTGPRRWVYLGGDCCHDPRILTGEKGIAMYDDGRGGVRSVHVDTQGAEETVARIRRLLGEGRVVQEYGEGVEVEIVVAHDKGWRERNGERFWPGCL